MLSALFLLGCGSGVAETSIPLPRWNVQLPGSATAHPIDLPAHFDRELPRAPATYRLSTEVVLPPAMQGRALTLAIPHMPGIATLDANGFEAVPIDASTLDRYRATNPQRWRIPAKAAVDGKVLLTLSISHRSARTAFVDATPVLTTHPLGGTTLTLVHGFNTASAEGAMAAGVVVALLYGFLFIAIREPKRRAPYGWFLIGTAGGISYPAFILGLTQAVFGVNEVGYLSVSLAAGSVGAMYLSRAYADAPRPHFGWWIAVGLVLVIAIVAHDPFVSSLVVGPLLLLLTFAEIGVQVAFLSRLRKEGRLGRTHVAVALAWPIAMLLGLPDLSEWVGLGENTRGLRMGCLGVMALALYQAYALSREHIIALRHAKDLVGELNERVAALSKKNAEVALLNDELRRQIAARSRDLAEKLALMEDIDIEPPRLEPGRVVDDRYRIVKHLGTGGMGAVYEVERVVDGKHFALKALVSSGDAQVRARFAREAQIVANVNHPNVVSIVDVDVSRDGFVFLVMELVESGKTLHDVRRRTRDVPWTVGVIAQVAEGIAAIHAAGVIHRDLKPGNILFSRGADGRKPEVKITDFGISSLQSERQSSAAFHARPPLDSLPPVSELPVTRPREPQLGKEAADDPAYAVTRQQGKGSDRPPMKSSPDVPPPEASNRRHMTPLTQTGIIFGTPQYMAQELTAGSKNANRASDVFSLGVIAFELLTGKRPFIEAPVNAKLNGRLPAAAPSFKIMVPTLPDDVVAILDRAISHDPRKRPSAEELAAVTKAAAKSLGA